MKTIGSDPRRQRLFVFPHAGSSCAHYWGWKRYLESDLEIVPVELPGRGSRFDVPLCTDMAAMVEDVFLQVSDRLAGGYSLFGHSMGALLAFELAHRIADSGLPRPNHLFISGRGAPHLREPSNLLQDRNQGRFRESLLALGGSTSELFDDPRLAEIFLPILEADIRLIGSHRHSAHRGRLPVPITVLCGREDAIPSGSLRAWREHTGKSFGMRLFDGGHFYLRHKADEICRIIVDTLKEDAVCPMA